MITLNEVRILGSVGHDLELQWSRNRKPYVKFSVCTHRKFRNVSQKDWHSIVCWGNLAEKCMRWLKKGSYVLVKGQITTRTWKMESGYKRKDIEILCHWLADVGERVPGHEPELDGELIHEDPDDYVPAETDSNTPAPDPESYYSED